MIILLGETKYNSDCEGFIIALKEHNKYLVNWDNNKTPDIASVYTENLKDKELNVTDDIIPDFNFYNPDISFYVKNGKIGIKSKEKKIIKNECDSLYIDHKIATIFNSEKIDLYNLNGKLLDKNLKISYSYSQLEHQIIDSKNNMYFIDTLGNKYQKEFKGKKVLKVMITIKKKDLLHTIIIKIKY